MKRKETRPIIVCLCGSTRFCDEEYHDWRGLTPWQWANLQETLAGKIVLSIGVDTKSDVGLELTEQDKDRLDALHLAKIDLADEVMWIDVEGYAGTSTKRELAYAQAQGKPIRRYSEAYPNDYKALLERRDLDRIAMHDAELMEVLIGKGEEE
jgi:hypothetical protein